MTSAEEVKSKLDIVEIVKDYISLKKRGASYFANCPFHQEKTPSFHVSSERQFYKCFGCNEGGDVFDFVQKMEGMDFPEALRLLADKAGVKIDRYDPKIYTRKNRLLDLLDISGRYYHEVLLRSPGAEEARAYLARRGLKSATIDLFNLGFAPNSWDLLLNFLVSKRYTAEEAFTAGLLVKRERGDGFYDRFRGRIMFPIRNVQGDTVGFTARILPSMEKNEKVGGKYINTPQTDFYNKSRILYGLDMAKSAIKNQDLAILVEGNMDVIACHEYGMKNVVAVSGTALTKSDADTVSEQIKYQIGTLRRFTENIAMSFDMDKAGEMAADKGISLLLSTGMNIRVIRLPEGAGKDPDEAIRKNSAVWNQAVAEAKPIRQYLFDEAKRRYGINDEEARKKFCKFIMSFIAKIADIIEQNFWFEELSQIMSVNMAELKTIFLQNFLSKDLRASMAAQKIGTEAAAPRSRFVMLAERLISLLLFAPQSLQFVVDRVTPAMMGSIALRRLYEATIFIYNNTGTLKYSDLEQKFGNEAEFKDLLQRITISGEEEFGGIKLAEAQKELMVVLKDLRECYLAEERKRLTGDLIFAEKEKDEEKVKEITVKIQELLKLGREYL